MINLTFVSLSAVKVPISVLGAEIDHVSPPELLKQFEEALAAKPEVVNRQQRRIRRSPGVIFYFAEILLYPCFVKSRSQGLLLWFWKIVLGSPTKIAKIHAL